MFSALQIPNYRLYAAGTLISNIGTWMQNTAVAWLVLVLTDSGTLLGIVLGLQLLPTLIFSPAAGLVADRYSKRKVLIISQTFMAIPSAVLGVLALTKVVQAWQVMILAFIFGVARAYEAPARQAFAAEMVDTKRLSSAVGLNSAVFNTGRIIGPAVAGLMIGVFGGGVASTGWVIMINALSYIATIGAIYFLNSEQLNPSKKAEAGRGAIRAGLKYTASRPDFVLVLTIVFFIGAFGMNFQITTALMATEVFGHGAEEFGLLGTIMAVGSVTGSLYAATRPNPSLRVVLVTAFSFALLQSVSGLMPTYWLYAAVLPLIGFSILTMAATINSFIQLTADPLMRGRISALYLMLFLGGVPFGAPLIGGVAEAWGARSALVFSGIASAVGISIALLWFFSQTRHSGQAFQKVGSKVNAHEQSGQSAK